MRKLTPSLLLATFAATLSACSAVPETAELPAFAATHVELILPSTGSLTAGTVFSSVVASRAPIGKVAAVKAGALPEGATLSDRGDGTALFSWTPAREQLGSHVVQVSAELEGESITADWTLKVVARDNRPPSWTAPAELWLLVGVSSELPIEPTDAEGDAVTVELRSAPPGVALLTDPFRLSFSLLTAGAFPVSIAVSDGAATAEYTIWLHVQHPGNYAPEVSPLIPEVTVQGGQPWSMRFSATDANLDPVVFSVQGPADMQFVGNELTWTPPHHGAGLVTVWIRASDGITATTHAMQFSVVEAANSAPALPVVGTLMAFQGAPMQKALQAVDTENDAISYSLSATNTSGPVTGLSIDAGGTLRWQVPAAFPAGGRVYATVTAVDSYSPPALSSRTYVIQVNANALPGATTSDPAMTYRGETLTMTFTGTDSDGGDLATLAAVTLPTGATFSRIPETNQWLFTWTPVGVGGEVALGIRATDLVGATSYWQPGKIIVLNQSPQISATFSNGFACLGRGKPFSVTATDPDNDPIEFGSNGIDVTYWGSPVTGGALAFTDFARPVSSAVQLQARDPFGGAAGVWASYRVFGWRSIPAVANRISLLTGTKASPIFLPIGAYDNPTGEGIALWQESVPGLFSRIYAQRVDSVGCPVWNAGEPSLVSGTPATKQLLAGIVNPTSLWSVYAAAPGDEEVCNSSGGYSHGLALSSMHLSDGTPADAICIAKANAGYDPKATRMTGSPATESKMISYGLTDSTDLQLLLLKATSAGTVSSTTYGRTYASVNLHDYSISGNTAQRFALGWSDAGDQSAKVVVVNNSGAEVFPPAVIAAAGTNVRTVLLENSKTVIVYNHDRYVKFVGVNDNGTLTTVTQTDTLDDAGAGNTIGSDGHLAGETPLGDASAVYFAWSKSGSVYVQRLEYRFNANTIVPVWNGGIVATKVNKEGINRNPRLALLGATLMVMWEQESGPQVIAMARALDTETGAPLGDPAVISSQPAPRVPAMIPLGGGIGISFIDYSNDPIHGDVALAYVGSAGNSRP